MKARLRALDFGQIQSSVCLNAPSLTSGSNRSLRSLGRAKARPLTKR